MPAHPFDLCGFDDCGHPFNKHPRVAGRWPCGVVGCGCYDFAQPGSVMSVGTFPDSPGNPEGN